MKRLKIFIICLLLLFYNQIYYLTFLQFTCTDKINTNKKLNLYEIASIYQTYTNLWLFGWVVSPNTAYACFNKQFHITNPILNINIPEDAKTQKAKRELIKNPNKKIKLTWTNYNSEASIYLNGNTISIINDSGIDYYLYRIPLDHKPGIIDIYGIKLSETNFDYLETSNIIATYTYNQLQKI